MKLSDYKVLSFDCYGTLIDWETGIWDAMQPLLMSNGRADIDRKTGLGAYAQFEYSHESKRPALPYPKVLELIHASIAQHFGLTNSSGLDQAFGASVPSWPAFTDSADALRILKSHFKLVILSNVNRDGFAASNRKLGVEFDAIYTAEDVGSYKPNPDNFEYLIRNVSKDLGHEAGDIMHTAQSLHHDHVQAKAFGLANTWIDRQGLSKGGDWGATAIVAQRPKTDFVFYSMMEMASAFGNGAPSKC